MWLELNKIRRDGGTQPRLQMLSETVSEYAEDMKNGDTFPPVRVVYDGDQYWLVDGFHRIAAAEQNGYETFECDVLQGTLQDAQWLSFGVNAAHGERRNRWDVQRIIAAALVHPMSKELSDTAIAKHIHCDHKTVGAQRARMVAAGEVPQRDTRVTADGRTMNVAGINANRGTSSSPAPAAAPPHEPDDDKIQEPAGGWPESDDDGNYPTELAEPVFCNKGHAQAVIHVLQIKPLGWKPLPRWIANAAIVGVSGCELTTPLDFTNEASTREEAIALAAQAMAVHILRCTQDESLLTSRRATLLWFLDWAGEQGANRIDAEDALKREEVARNHVYVRLAENVLFGVIALADETGRDAEAFQNWGRIVTEMMAFADAGDVDGADEMKTLIDQVDRVEARFATIITAMREYKARQLAA